MKPFNLEAAKRGDKVVTRGNAQARIVCFDAKTVLYGTPRPLIVLIENGCGGEDVVAYGSNGNYYSDNSISTRDLMMASKKRQLWINLYGNGTSSIHNTKIDANKEAVELGVHRGYRIGLAHSVEIEE